MRTILVVVLLCSSLVSSQSQEETLFSDHSQTGGFGGPVVIFTNIRGQSALMFGGRGGWVIDHSLSLGGGAYGLVTEVDAPQGVLPLEGPLDVKFSTFGFELEYLSEPMSMMHTSFYVLLGGGATNYAKDIGSPTENLQTGETDFMFVIEPALSAEMNILTWLRINAGVRYRYVGGVEQEGLSNGDFRGLAAHVCLKFGDL